MARKQKPGNKRRLRVKKNRISNSIWIRTALRYSFLVSAGLGLVIVLIWGLELSRRAFLDSLALKSPLSTIHFSSESVTHLDQGERVDIEAWISKNLEKHGSMTAGDLAKAIHRKFDPKKVSVFVQSRDEINVNVVPRIALAKIIENSQALLVDQEGAIFTRIVSNQALQSLPTLTEYGVSNSDSDPGKDHRVTIESALELLAALRSAGFSQLTTFRRILYRGHEVHFSDPPMQVVFRNNYFDQQIERLKEVLYQSNRQGKYASRIELDYHGKVFIKYKI